MSPLEIASNHCRAARPPVCLKPFIHETYGVGYDYLRAVSLGHRKPSAKLIQGMNQAHVRLFPSEPVILELPNHPPVILGHNSTANS